MSYYNVMTYHRSQDSEGTREEGRSCFGKIHGSSILQTSNKKVKKEKKIIKAGAQLIFAALAVQIGRR